MRRILPFLVLKHLPSVYAFLHLSLDLLKVIGQRYIWPSLECWLLEIRLQLQFHLHKLFAAPRRGTPPKGVQRAGDARQGQLGAREAGGQRLAQMGEPEAEGGRWIAPRHRAACLLLEVRMRLWETGCSP